MEEGTGFLQQRPISFWWHMAVMNPSPRAAAVAMHGLAHGQPGLSSLSAVPAALSTRPATASARGRPASRLLPEEEAGAALRASCSSE